MLDKKKQKSRWFFINIFFFKFRNLLWSLTLIAISKVTLNFFMWLKMTDSSYKTLKIRTTCKNQGGPPYALK